MADAKVIWEWFSAPQGASFERRNGLKYLKKLQKLSTALADLMADIEGDGRASHTTSFTRCCYKRDQQGCGKIQS